MFIIVTQLMLTEISVFWFKRIKKYMYLFIIKPLLQLCTVPIKVIKLRLILTMFCKLICFPTGVIVL